jgi:hypothetical protein
VLLVIVDNALAPTEYRAAFTGFKQTLEDNAGSAISTLRYLAGAQSSSNRARASETNTASRNLSVVTGGLRSQSRSVMTGGGTAQEQPSAQLPSQDEKVGILKEYLLAINQLSQFSKKYLGTAVIVNYWKSSRPQVKWLEGFQIDRTGNVTCLAENTQLIHQPVSPQQQQWLRDWVQSFVKRCSTVIRDFPRLAAAEAFSEDQKRLFPLNVD